MQSISISASRTRSVTPTQVRVGRETHQFPTDRSWAYASPLLLLAFVPFFGNWRYASRAGHRDTADFAKDLLNSVEPYGVLVTVGDNDTFPLWYAQEVEGVRRDVVIANTSLLNTDWYVRQIIRRPVFDYDAAKGPAVYRNAQWAKPKGPPLHMSMDDADSVPSYMELQRPMLFSKDSIRATIDPAKLEHPGILQRADLFVLRMIQDSWPERPIYFARTSGTYARQLGLGDYTLTQGLASKVFIPPKTTPKDTMFVQSDGWLDLPRTQALWSNVFVGPQSVLNTGDWIDRPSVGIPYLYIATGMELADALRSKGQDADAMKVFTTAKQIASAVRLGEIVREADAAFRTPRPETAPARGGAPTGDTGRAVPLPATKAPPATPVAPSKAPTKKPAPQ